MIHTGIWVTNSSPFGPQLSPQTNTKFSPAWGSSFIRFSLVSLRYSKCCYEGFFVPWSTPSHVWLLAPCYSGVETHSTTSALTQEYQVDVVDLEYHTSLQPLLFPSYTPAKEGLVRILSACAFNPFASAPWLLFILIRRLFSTGSGSLSGEEGCGLFLHALLQSLCCPRTFLFKLKAKNMTSFYLFLQ